MQTIASIWGESIDLDGYYGYEITKLCYSDEKDSSWSSIDLSLIGSHFIYKINDSRSGEIYSKYINIHKFEHVWDSNESIQWGLFSMKNDINNDNLILAFRGTVNFEDMIHDINLNREGFLCTHLKTNKTQECPLYFKHDTNKSDIAISYVYDGFNYILHYYDAIIESIKQLQVNDNKNKFKKLLVTGHSLGGAYAIIMSILMQINNFHLEFENQLQVVTFGAPLVVISIKLMN